MAQTNVTRNIQNLVPAVVMIRTAVDAVRRKEKYTRAKAQLGRVTIVMYGYVCHCLRPALALQREGSVALCTRCAPKAS